MQWYPIISARLTFAPMGVIKRDVGAIARRLIVDSSEDIFPNYDGSCSCTRIGIVPLFFVAVVELLMDL